MSADDENWHVALRDDQIDCVIDCLTYLVERHRGVLNMEHSNSDTPLQTFAFQQSLGRIEEVLNVFTQIGHRT